MNEIKEIKAKLYDLNNEIMKIKIDAEKKIDVLQKQGQDLLIKLSKEESKQEKGVVKNG
jgi:hypothetical protein